MSKYIKIDWGDSSNQAPTKETFLAYIASLQKQINDNKITVDNQLSDTSENAVQNKVVKSELDKRQDKITSETSLTIGDLDIQTTLTLKNSDESSNVEAILMSGSSQYRNDIEYPSIDFYGRTTEDYDTHNVILSNIETPEENNQAANKEYVDTEVAKNKIVITTF